MTATSTSLGPRPFDLSGTDQRGAVMTVSILFIIYALMILAMRLAAKYRNMTMDDSLAIIATALAIPQSISNIVAVEHGFGAPLDLFSQSQHNTVASALRTSDVFFLLNLLASKASVIWLCRRLFSAGRSTQALLWQCLVAGCAIWCLGSLLAVNIGCTGLEITRAGQGRCPGIVARWGVVGAFDALAEVVISALSVMELVALQMSGSRKFQASVCFSLRLPIIVFIILHLKALSNFNSAKDPSVALTKVQIFRQCEMVYSLLSSSIPSLNQYLRKFNTQEATQFGFNPTHHSNRGGSGGGSKGLSLPFKSLSKNKTTGSQADSWKNGSNDYRIQEQLTQSTSYKALVETQNDNAQDGLSEASNEDVSFGRHGSQDQIIRKDVVYEVRHEN